MQSSPVRFLSLNFFAVVLTQPTFKSKLLVVLMFPCYQLDLKVLHSIFRILYFLLCILPLLVKTTGFAFERGAFYLKISLFESLRK